MEIYPGDLDDCMAYGPWMKVWVDAYNQARKESQRRDTVASEACRLRNVNVPIADRFPRTSEVYKLMAVANPVAYSFSRTVEVVAQIWDTYKSTLEVYIAAACVRREIVAKETVPRKKDFETHIKAKTQTIVNNWCARVVIAITETVDAIQVVLKNAQSIHQESLNKLLRIIGEVVDVDAYQLSSSTATVKKMTYGFKPKTSSFISFINKVADIPRYWDVVMYAANARMLAYNLQIGYHIAKDIVQLIVKAMKTEVTTENIALATREREVADWALKAVKSEAELQSMIQTEQMWVTSTLDEIQTVISEMEPFFQTNTNPMVQQQQVSRDCLMSLLEVARKMMDFQWQVVDEAKQQKDRSFCTHIDTFQKACTNHQLIIRTMDTYRRAIRATEYVIMITRFLAKVEKTVETVDLVHKIKTDMHQKIKQAPNEMIPLTTTEYDMLSIKISTMLEKENGIGNVLSTSTTSSLPRKRQKTFFVNMPTKLVAAEERKSFLTPPSKTVLPPAAVVLNPTIASGVVIQKVIMIQKDPKNAINPNPTTPSGFTIRKVTDPKKEMSRAEAEVISINKEILTLNQTLNQYGQKIIPHQGFLERKVENQMGKNINAHTRRKIDEQIKSINDRIATINEALKGSERQLICTWDGFDTLSLTLSGAQTDTGSSNLSSTVTVPASSHTTTTPIMIEEQETEQKMATVLVGLSTTGTSPMATVISPSEVRLDQTGIEKQKKRKIDA
jgi:hypothetical protein